jgi:L-alanine-DL-glutamate epimerase-like enolase superfamily enzyme
MTFSELTSDQTASLGIRAIETALVRVELPRIYRGSSYLMTHRSTVVTRVHTDAGIVGEAYAGDEDASLGQIDAIIHNEIAPRIQGLDAMRIEQCWSAARPATADILRDRRLGLVASAAVDAALWDAVGKLLGQPLWKLWGGFRREVPMIVIGGYYDSGTSIEDEIAWLKETGVAGLKFKVGGRSPEEDAVRFRAARAVAGPDFLLAADANQGYTPQDAIRFANLVSDCDMAWFEEPCRWANDRRAMRAVRTGAPPTPVCAGQSEFSAAGCRDLMEEGAIDICNFDASWSGGPTEWRRAAAIAHAYDIRMGHHEEPQISTHLIASIPHGTVAECFHPDRDPIWWNLIANRPPLVGGCIQLTDAPGFGWQLDEDYIAEHRVDRDGMPYRG